MQQHPITTPERATSIPAERNSTGQILPGAVTVTSPRRAWLPAPNLGAGDMLERFLVSAVAAFLGIRAYLELSGYPQVGGGGLHVAHMLWGGLLMLVAIVLLIGFLGKRVKYAAAILGGAGFGTFIDELGKFITSDHNYFFQPTVALIYALFVLLYLVFRGIGRQSSLSPSSYLANAVDAVRDAMLHGASEDDRARVHVLLDRSDPDEPLVGALRSVLDDAPEPAPSRWIARLGLTSRIHYMYIGFVRWRWFQRAVVAMFVVNAIAIMLGPLVFIVSDPGFNSDQPDISFAETGSGVTSALANVLIVFGVVRLRSSRLAAYLWFKRSTLVSVFLVQFFAFYQEEFIAIFSLLISIVILAALNFAISREQVAPAGIDGMDNDRAMVPVLAS